MKTLKAQFLESAASQLTLAGASSPAVQPHSVQENTTSETLLSQQHNVKLCFSTIIIRITIIVISNILKAIVFLRTTANLGKTHGLYWIKLLTN